jgi:type I restriction enzyme S subunit
MLITPFVKRQIDSLAIGIAQKTLNLSAIKSIEIILPPITLQKEFASRITLIDQQKQQAQQSLEKAEALFNSLLQRAFKGELVS